VGKIPERRQYIMSEFFEHMLALGVILLIMVIALFTIIGLSIVFYNMLLHFSLEMGGVVSG
jgi:hypothetical protein